jgi:hypothetical protein
MKKFKRGSSFWFARLNKDLDCCLVEKSRESDAAATSAISGEGT